MMKIWSLWGFFFTLFLVNRFFKATTFTQPQGGVESHEAGLSTKNPQHTK